MLEGGISDPRNKALMKMLNMIGIGERAGSGVPDIFAIWDSQRWVAPKVEEQYNPDKTILTLSFIKKSVDKLSKCQMEILLLKKSGQEYSADEIAELMGLKGSRTRQLLKQLVDQKKVNTTAGTKNRRYIMAE